MLIHYTVGKAENLCVKRDIVNVFINRTAVLKENFAVSEVLKENFAVSEVLKENFAVSEVLKENFAVSDKTLDKNIIFVIINVKIQFDFLTVNQERKAICSQNTVI
ncbi:hypothetical protein I7R71_05110 [Neisseria meningitidis]|nr:hypothetical protein [Neisseria meningitidis]MBH2022317.1 hypothetical protein [Neisseria meningitidis]MBH2046374.1 hypothetical protein [Neisseria meningitidis]MBH2054456.1 hypothetical protein [Neisseria meningitidis]MBH2059538.1 hypothetical protein [Neisseria meningitidis]